MAPSYKHLQRKKARFIRSETNDKSLNKGSILNVSEFLNSRSFEINELAKAQLNSKFSASTRVFQNLPRKLRRRTASHNVKRIPKRLRKRALREMQINTTTNEGVVKKKLPIKGKEIYRMKMRKNLLTLLSSLNQEQRKIIDNEEITTLKFKDVKIRSRIKEISKILKDNKNLMQTNNEIGSFDNTGINKYSLPPVGKMKYYKRQREFAWLTTHVWHAKRAHMIKQHGFQIPLAPTQKLYKLSHRNFHYKGGMFWDKSYINTLILSGESQKELIEVLEKLVNGKIGKRYLTNGGIVNRFIYNSESQILGAVEIVTLNYKSKFNSVLRLHPSIYQTVFDYILTFKPESITLQDNKFSIGSIEITGPNSMKSLTTVLKPLSTKNTESTTWIKLANEANIPNGTIFIIQMKDPRLVNRKKVPKDRGVDLNQVLIDMKMDKSTTINEDVIEKFITPEGRTESYKDQLSLKSIGKIKASSSTSLSELHIVANFPVIIYKSKDTWKVLTPWYWILPIWQSLSHIAHLNFGGILQSRQLDFEKSWFNYPKDYQFTQIGFKENETNGALIQNKWSRKPKSKRFNYKRLKLNPDERKYNLGELGDWSKCDWRYLQLLKFAFGQLGNGFHVKRINVSRTSDWDHLFNRKIKEIHDVYHFINDIVQFEKSQKDSTLFVPIRLSPSTEEVKELESTEDQLQVTSVKFSLTQKGNLKPNARVYTIPPGEANTYLKNQHPEDILLPVPHSKYLIGFVTSANFNLLAGENTGVGLIESQFVKDSKIKTVLVRNAGTDVIRVANFEEVSVL